MKDFLTSTLHLFTWQLLLTLASLALTILLAEILQRNDKMHGENSRKFIHIVCGLIIATSALYLGEKQLFLLCGILTGGILVLELPFGAIHSLETIKRKSIGQYVYAVGIGLVLIMYQSRALFMAAVLVMTLADGMAAVIGSRYGRKKFRFHIPGGYKTYIGSLTFFVISLTIFAAYLYTISHGTFGTPIVSVNVRDVLIITAIAGVVTLSEAFVAYGLDNITVPILSAILLAWLI